MSVCSVALLRISGHPQDIRNGPPIPHQALYGLRIGSFWGLFACSRPATAGHSYATVGVVNSSSCGVPVCISVCQSMSLFYDYSATIQTLCKFCEVEDFEEI